MDLVANTLHHVLAMVKIAKSTDQLKAVNQYFPQALHAEQGGVVVADRSIFLK